MCGLYSPRYSGASARGHAEKCRDLSGRYSCQASGNHGEEIIEQFGNLALGSVGHSSSSTKDHHPTSSDYHCHQSLHHFPDYHHSFDNRHSDNPRTFADEHGLAAKDRVSLSDGQRDSFERSNYEHCRREGRHDDSNHGHGSDDYDHQDYDRQDYNCRDYDQQDCIQQDDEFYYSDDSYDEKGFYDFAYAHGFLKM